MYNIALPLLDQKDSLVIRQVEGKSNILDPIRKKYVRLTPEEWVRQLLLEFIVSNAYWSRPLIAVEKTIQIGQKRKRFDILLYKDIDQPHVLIECKSPGEPLRQKHFDQILNYNMKLNVPFIWMSNGHENYIAQVDFERRQLNFIATVEPIFE